MRIGTQLAIGGALLLTIGGSALLYRQIQVDGEAVAAVDRGRELSRAEAGKVRERVEAVGTKIAREAMDVVPLTSGRVAEIAFRPGQPVAEGAVLVRLDERMEQAAVSEASGALRQAELALERARQLRSNNTVFGRRSTSSRRPPSAARRASSAPSRSWPTARSRRRSPGSSGSVRSTSARASPTRPC